MIHHTGEALAFIFRLRCWRYCSVEVEIFFAKQADLHVLLNTSIAQVQHKQNTRHSEQNLYISISGQDPYT